MMNKILIIDIDCIAGAADSSKEAASRSFRAGVFKYLSRIADEFDYSLVLLRPENVADNFLDEVTRVCVGEDIIFTESINQSELEQRLKWNEKSIQKIITGSSYPLPDLKGVETISFSKTSGVESQGGTWQLIYQALKQNARRVDVVRKTSETDIRCSINLDGSGKNEISTGLGFFDHMLQQIARHGNLDLFIDVKGDLHIDEHHTIEDVGLTLGAALSEALGNKKGIERYGFLLPMDDCLAQVAIDFGGRPWLVWDAVFTREKVGDMPTEMFHHFFKSFSDAAKCNLNIKAEGSNEHHKIESIFKAFAKSIGMAIKKNNNNIIPSTKGSL